MPQRTTPVTPRETQCKKPTGWMGRFTLWRMNKSHSKLTDWGLGHLSVQPQFTVLDVGCGGGRTISKLAELAKQGKVHGIDYSEASVAASRRYNARAVKQGRVQVHESEVSKLPFQENSFDLVAGVETHFWWPDIPAGIGEIRRVLKSGGTLMLIAEVYKGANTTMARLCEKHAPFTGMTMLTPEEHGELLAAAGLTDVRIDTLAGKGWIAASARK
jgi:ubiquinone/menaquinone biosynthesis C-methylase UbiE